MEFKKWRPAPGYRFFFFDYPEFPKITIPALNSLCGLLI